MADLYIKIKNTRRQAGTRSKTAYGQKMSTFALTIHRRIPIRRLSFIGMVALKVRTGGSGELKALDVERNFWEGYSALYYYWKDSLR